MKLIFDPEVRNIIKQYLKKNKFVFDDNRNIKNLNITGIDEIGNLLKERVTESRKEAKEYISKELSVAFLGVKTLGTLSLCINSEKNGSDPIKKNWAGDNKPNPNFVFQQLVVQLTNYSLSVIHLIEVGLDSSAKPIVRSIHELSLLIIVLLIDKERINLFTQDLDRANEREIWRQYFSFKKINTVLKEFEDSLKLPEEIKKKLEEVRMNVYSDYSQSIHNSYVSSILGSLSLSHEDSEDLNLNLFGKYSVTSKQILSDLGLSLFNFLFLIQPVLKNHHNFLIPMDNNVWSLFLCLKDCYANAYLYVTYYKDIKKLKQSK